MSSPIPVAMLAFVRPQIGPGMSASENIKHCEADSRSRHEIEYHPWLRSFVVRTGDAVNVYPESSVERWRPLGELPAPPKKAPVKKG